MNEGAGLHLYRTTATVYDCVITDNIVDAWSGDALGGGIYSYESDIIVERCEISNNICDGGWNSWVQGGGIYCDRGTAIISDCIISSNSSETGGGIYLIDTDYPAITGCDIMDNVATLDNGGGLYVWSSDYSMTVSECLFAGNYAASGGAGIMILRVSQASIHDCTFILNLASEQGGGIWNYSEYTDYQNLVLRSNAPDQISIGAGDPQITWSNIEGGWPGEGNIDEEPMFVAPEYGDYRLLWGSPCIDSGNPDSLDLDGTVRDMGARSFDQSKELIVYLSPETREIASGDSARVRYTVCNAHPHEKNFGTAAGVRLPGGAPWPGNPLENPFYTSIAPSSNLAREFEYRIPLGWIPGTYSLAAGVGHRGRIYDLDHFEFRVVEDTTDQR